MSTFDILESSLEASQPIEVYRFSIGSQSYRFTSSEDLITLGSDVFQPISIARTNIVKSQDDRKRVMTVTVPATNPFAQRYVVTPPGLKAILTIIRLQRNETPTFATQAVIYRGAVQSVQFPDSGETAQISVQTIEAATGRIIPRFTYMGVCNNVLYDEFCTANPDNFDHIGTVTAVSGSQITLSGAAASGFDFTGGYCKPTAASDFRLILSQSGDVLTLLLPFETNVLNTSVQAFAGCDHLIEGDCALVFDNVINFGGFAFVPNKDIFRTGLDQ